MIQQLCQWPMPVRPEGHEDAGLLNRSLTGQVVHTRSPTACDAVLLLECLRIVKNRNVTIRFRAFGHSMSPTIRNGDVLSISPIDRDVAKGDVVAFVHPRTGRIVVHRIVSKQGNKWAVRGDNALEEDDAIDRKHLLGRLSRIERGGRTVPFGIGPEKRLIALMIRSGAWRRLLAGVSRCIRRIRMG